jgi:hypothetical protein
LRVLSARPQSAAKIAYLPDGLIDRGASIDEAKQELFDAITKDPPITVRYMTLRREIGPAGRGGQGRTSDRAGSVNFPRLS